MATIQGLRSGGCVLKCATLPHQSIPSFQKATHRPQRSHRHTPHHTHRNVTAQAEGQAGGSASASTTFEQRQAGIKLQFEDLKIRAKEAHAECLAAASNQASTSGRLAGDASSGTAPLRERIESAIVSMSEGLIERDTEVRLLLLAALAGEHILYIGPPGTAKSELGRRLSRLCHGRYFERLLTRFSVPEELFGPLSMRALEEDQYIRQTRGYLPEATVAFIDEIFKANSAILNTLLTILNERLFDNGADRSRVPLLCLVGASNELPESEELDALYDRFLLRRQVSQVSPAGLLEMLSSGGVAGLGGGGGMTSSNGSAEEKQLEPLLIEDDFMLTRARAQAAVSIPPEVLNIIADLRAFLQDKCEPPVYVSDRRLVKSVALMQVAAYSSGRTMLADYDCLLLRHILWQRPEESERIYEWLLTALAADDGMQQMQYLLSGLFGRACKVLGDADAVAVLAGEVGQLRETLASKLSSVYASTLGGLATGQTLWMGEDEAEAVGSALLPKLDRTVKELEALLFEVVTLETALLGGATALELAQLLRNQWAQFLRGSQ